MCTTFVIQLVSPIHLVSCYIKLLKKTLSSWLIQEITSKKNYHSKRSIDPLDGCWLFHNQAKKRGVYAARIKRVFGGRKLVLRLASQNHSSPPQKRSFLRPIEHTWPGSFSSLLKNSTSYPTLQSSATLMYLSQQASLTRTISSKHISVRTPSIESQDLPRVEATLAYDN